MTSFPTAYATAGPTAYPVTAQSGPLANTIKTLLSGFQTRADGRIDLNGWEDARAASLWVPDYNGVLQEIPGGIPLVVDSATGRAPRVVRNIVWDAQDVTSAVWYKVYGASAVDSRTLNFPPAISDTWGEYSSAYIALDSSFRVKGKRFVARVLLSGNPGETIVLKLGVSGGSGSQANSSERTITLTNTPTWYSVDIYIYNPGTWGPNLYLSRLTSNTASTVYMDGVQVEESTWRANFYIPSEFTIEQLAYYTTENANTIDANGAVTDAVGAPITPTGQWAFEHWPGSTNYFLDSFAPATQTITLPSTGSYTLSVRGSGSVSIAAGTAVGTGWGTATDGNPVTVDITTAGSVTCTVTGSPDAVQLEDQPFASPVIQTSGASATRDACTIRHTSAGALNQDEGMLVIDVVRDIGSDQSWLFGLTANFLGTRSTITGQCYQQGSIVDNFGVVMYDGTNGASEYGVSWRNGDVIRYAVRWNASTGKMQPGFKDTSSVWHWGPEKTYGGAFNDSGYWYLLGGHVQNCKTPMLAVYNKDKGAQWIEDNY